MYNEISANKRKSALLLALFAGLVTAAGFALSFFLSPGEFEPTFTGIVVVALLVYMLVSYYGGSRMAVALSGGKEIQKKDNPRLWRTVENLAITNGMPMPKVYIMDDPAPNAFATGRNPSHAIVAATTGLLEIMDDSELEGVMAHELGHVKNYDIRVSLIAFAMVAAIALVADLISNMLIFGSRNSDDSKGAGLAIFAGIAAAIIAPLVASLIQLAISRQREYLADATGVMTTRYPDGLARALEKLQANARPMRRQHSSTAHFFISNPLAKKNLSGLFSTHPPIEERVKRIRNMGDNV